MLVVKNPPANAGDTRDAGSIPGWGWRREWLPTPAFLPGESHRLRSLVGYSPPAHTELDTAEVTWHTHTHTENAEREEEK